MFGKRMEVYVVENVANRILDSLSVATHRWVRIRTYQATEQNCDYQLERKALWKFIGNHGRTRSSCKVELQ
jgi:hypothetical protein